MNRSLGALMIVMAAAIAACSGSMMPTLGRGSPSAPSPQTPIAQAQAEYSLSGMVSESAGGRTIEGATVLLSGGSTTTTDKNGFFRFENLLAWQLSSIRFSKPGFEDSYARYNGDGSNLDVRMQRTIEISAGDVVRSAVYPDDPQFSDWLSENVCQPCRQIRIAVHAQGMLTVRVQAPTESAGIGLIVQTASLSSGIQCCQRSITRSFRVAPEEVKVMVFTEPASPSPLPFDLATSLSSGL